MSIVIINTLKYILVDLKHSFALRHFKAIWRKNNKHNLTNPGNEFQASKVIVGKGTYGTLNIVSYENPDEQLIIGNYCSIAGGTVFLLSGQHNMKTLSTYPFKRILLKGPSESGCKGAIIVSDDVWIGYRATILSGVKIGQGAVIAAGAVVTHDVEPYSIVGGVPAKKIGMRFNESLVNRLMSIDYERLDDNYIMEHIEQFNIPVNNEADLDCFYKKG